MLNFTKYIPRLSFNNRKGNCGRIGVIGGCFEYTGAPYFSSITALKLGADLSHVFCSKSAAIPIKSYSPDLIVHPYLPDNDDNNETILKSVENVKNWLHSMDAIVIGPGLGRSDATIEFTKQMINVLKNNFLGKPVVLDADCLFVVAQNPELIKDCNNFILTPNRGEYMRLCRSINIGENSTPSELFGKLSGPSLFVKDRFDIFISHQNPTGKTFTFEGAPVRAGGQGDLISGAMALFASYAPNNLVDAAGAVSELVRSLLLRVFKEKGRSIVASDLINEIYKCIPEQWNQVIES